MFHDPFKKIEIKNDDNKLEGNWYKSISKFMQFRIMFYACFNKILFHVINSD